MPFVLKKSGTFSFPILLECGSLAGTSEGLKVRASVDVETDLRLSKILRWDTITNPYNAPDN